MFARLAARWQFAGDRLRDARTAAAAAAESGQSAYQRFLGRLGAVKAEEPDDSPGAVCLFGLVLRLQAQVRSHMAGPIQLMTARPWNLEQTCVHLPLYQQLFSLFLSHLGLANPVPPYVCIFPEQSDDG